MKGIYAPPELEIMKLLGNEILTESTEGTASGEIDFGDIWG